MTKDEGRNDEGNLKLEFSKHAQEYDWRFRHSDFGLPSHSDFVIRHSDLKVRLMEEYQGRTLVHPELNQSSPLLNTSSIPSRSAPTKVCACAGVVQYGGMRTT